MNPWGISLLLLAGAAASLIAFMIVTLRRERGVRRDVSLFQKYFGRRVNLHRLNVFFQKSYVHVMRIPGLRRYVLKIRRRLELLQAFDEYSLRRQTMQITFSVLSVSCLLIIGLLLLTESLLMIFFILLGALFLNGLLIDTFITRVENNLLRKSIIFFEDNRNFFQETRNVEDALFQAVEIAPHAIDRQAKRIHEVLTAQDNQLEMEKYYEVAPNKFLKLFASYAFIVHQFGDRIVEKKSVYLHALSELIKDTNLEISRREKLSYRLKGLSTIAVAPVLFIETIESWATNNFPIMMEYYESRIGVLTLVSIFLVIVGCYVGIRKLLENEENRYIAKVKRWKWEQRLYQIPVFRQLVDRLTPRRFTRKHFTLTKLIKDANSPLTLEWLTVRRILMALAAFIFSVGMFMYLHTITINNALFNPFQGFGFFGGLTEEDYDRAKEITQFDRMVIEDLKQSKETVTLDTVIDKLREDNSQVHTDLSVLQTAHRIYEKYLLIQDEFFKWWELLISLVTAYFSYHIPVMILYLQKRIRAMDMQNEVNQMHSILSVLIHFERMDVETILEWLSRFSLIFKEPIHRCLITYQSGPYEALEQLEMNVSYEPFQRIVQKLKLAVERITISEAFDDLEMTRLQNLQEREEQFMRSVENKSMIGMALGFTPMFYIVFMYLVIPMLYLSSVQMQESLIQIQNL